MVYQRSLTSWLLLSIVLSSICTLFTFAKLTEPTNFGTKQCKHWPSFTLQDYNPSSRATYLQTYGISDIDPRGDVTVVGLYYGDSNISQQAIQYQEKMYYYLRDHEDINVQNVAINFYAPKACAELDCEPVWTLKKWWYYTNSCDGYIGGCAPGDERLQVDNWQGLLADETVMPIFQDEYWVDAWERFGGGEGDLFIYDSEGRLYAIFCSERHAELMDCTDVFPDGAEGLTEASYKTLKSVVSKAAKSNSADRCEDFDDYYYGGYATYYNDDDDDSSSNNKGDDDDDDTLVNPNPNPHDDDDNDADDDYYYYYYYYDDDEPNNRFNLGFHNAHQKQIKKTIPSWVFASFAAIAVFVTSGVLLYMRHRRQATMREYVMGSKAHSGATQFTRLATDDDEEGSPHGRGGPGGSRGNKKVMIELDRTGSSGSANRDYGSL